MPYQSGQKISALAVTPSQRHQGHDLQILQSRREVYEKAKARNGNRWSGATRNWEYIDHVWLNPPKGKSIEPALSQTA